MKDLASTKSYYQYRITINGEQSRITDSYSEERWSAICERIEARGGIALLERRLVTDSSILALLSNPTGYIQLPDEDIVVCPWEYLTGYDGG